MSRHTGHAAELIALRCEGRYLLCTSITGRDPGDLWTFYIQLTEVYQAAKELKNDLDLLGLDLPAQPPPKITAKQAKLAAEPIDL